MTRKTKILLNLVKLIKSVHIISVKSSRIYQNLCVFREILRIIWSLFSEINNTPKFYKFFEIILKMADKFKDMADRLGKAAQSGGAGGGAPKGKTRRYSSVQNREFSKYE